MVLVLVLVLAMVMVMVIVVMRPESAAQISKTLGRVCRRESVAIHPNPAVASLLFSAVLGPEIKQSAAGWDVAHALCKQDCVPATGCRAKGHLTVALAAVLAAVLAVAPAVALAAVLAKRSSSSSSSSSTDALAT